MARVPPEKKLRMPRVPGCARLTSQVVWKVCDGTRISPLQPTSVQARRVNWSWNLVEAPIGSVAIAWFFSGRNPACLQSTATRITEKGSARITRS